LGDMLSASYYFTSGDEIPVTFSRDNKKMIIQLRAVDHPSMHRELALSPQGIELPMVDSGR